MRPLIWAGAAAAIAAVAGAAWTARGLPPRPATAAIVSAVQAAESAAPIYYRDPDGKPLYSLHSQVDGINHGVVAALELGSDLVLIAKGPGRVLKLPLAGLAEETGS